MGMMVRRVRVRRAALLAIAVATILLGSIAPVVGVERRSMGTAVTIRAIDFSPDGSSGVAVGDLGSVFVTADHAASWRRVSAGTDAHLRAVAIGVSGCAGCVLAVGDGGTILLSSDNGSAWCRQESTTTRPLQGVASGGDVTVVVGDDGTLLRTPQASTCGAIYSPLVSPRPGTSLSDVAFVSDEFYVVGRAGTAFAVGINGVVRPIGSDTTSDLEAVDGASSSATGSEAQACECTSFTRITAVGADGTVVSGGTVTRFSGERRPVTDLHLQDVGVRATLRDVSVADRGLSTFRTIVVGDEGTALIGIANEWTTAETGRCADLYTVWDNQGYADLSVAAGERGTVLTGLRSSPEARGCPASDRSGYRFVGADGGVFTFGDRRFHGSTGGLRLSQPVVSGTTRPTDFDGYWLLARDGGVFAFGAEFHGSLGGQSSAPAVDIEATPTGGGYWIVLGDGSVRPFGDARTFGDLGGVRLNRPIVAMKATPTGSGYWLLGDDGGVFAFGDARFHGSTGDRRLNAPVIDIAAASAGGYYLLARDGGVFTFGDATFHGSTGDLHLNAPVVSMHTVADATGYWLAAADGGVFTFGDLPFHGSTGGTPLNAAILGMIG